MGSCKHTFAISLFVSLLVLHSCTQSNTASHLKTKTDSLIAYMQTYVNPYLQNHEPELAKRILDSLSAFALKSDDYRLTCTWLNFKESQTALLENYDSAGTYAQRSLDLALKKDSTKKFIVEAQTRLAFVFNAQKLYDKALRYATGAYYLAQKADTAQLPVICLRLYDIYDNMGDLPSMRRFLFEGYRHSTQPVYRTVFANGITRYYAKVRQVDSAMLFFKEEEKDTSFHTPYFDAIKYSNFGILLSNNSKPNEGLAYLLKSAWLFRNIRETGGMTYEDYYNLALTYYRLKDYAQVFPYLDTTMVLAKEEKAWAHIRYVWDLRAGCYKELGRYDKAYAASDSALYAYRTEFDSSVLANAKEIEGKYALKSKEDEIKSLAVQNRANERLAYQQRVTIFSLTITLICLMVMGALLWRRRQMKMEIRETALRLKSLTTRLNPHFIFNNLAVLQSSIRNDEPSKSLHYLSRFARLMRLIFKNAQEDYVPLKDEVEVLDKYLSLQATNLENSFEYSINVDESLQQDEIQLPPMLLQPLVENAVLHGVSKVDYAGKINIVITKQGDMLHCIIEDNGAGLNGSDVKLSSTKAIKERLSILSRQTKKRATLSLVDKLPMREGTGVRVILDIPYT